MIRRMFAVGVLVFIAGASVSQADDADALVGSWSWSWKDASEVTHKHVLVVEGSGDKLAARELYDNDEPIKVTDLKRSGNKVTFSVLRGKRRSAYTGTIKAKDLIEGIVNVTTDGQANEFGWEARREPKKT